MSEQGMRKKVVQALKPLDAISVENSCGPGTPDVNYVDGWLELKWARTWPKKPETPLRLEHFTRQQRLWLIRRWKAGGRAFVLLKVGVEWLLFDAPTAADKLGRSTRAELYEVATQVWTKRLSATKLIEAVTIVP